MKKVRFYVIVIMLLSFYGCNQTNDNATGKVQINMTAGIPEHYSDQKIVEVAEITARNNEYLAKVMKRFQEEKTYKTDRGYPFQVIINRDSWSVNFIHDGCEYDGEEITLTIHLTKSKINEAEALIVSHYELKFIPCGYE